MTNETLLRKYIKESGYKTEFIAHKIGLSYQGFLNKLVGKNEFKQSEIVTLVELLKIPPEDREAIFFNQV